MSRTAGSLEARGEKWRKMERSGGHQLRKNSMHRVRRTRSPAGGSKDPGQPRNPAPPRGVQKRGFGQAVCKNPAHPQRRDARHYQLHAIDKEIQADREHKTAIKKKKTEEHQTGS